MIEHIAHILNRELSEADTTLLKDVSESLCSLCAFRDDPALLMSALIELERQGVLDKSSVCVEFVNERFIRVLHSDRPPGNYRSVKTLEEVDPEEVASSYEMFAFSVEAS